MTALIKANPQLPAGIQKLAQLALNSANELSGGVQSGFPIISYKGKVWRIRKGGEEEMHLDAQGSAMPTIDVVLVQANPTLSKIFYDKTYEEGSTDTPRCFSNDGVKPDASIQAPISKTCAVCPNNVWGSKITQNGKKTRACSDARRMAVVLADDLNENGIECQKYLLRVPPASLNPLKDYAEKTLAPKGIPFFGLVTRIGFDPQVAHPQFTLRPARFVNDDEADDIAALRGSEDVRRILAEAQEFPAGAAGGDQASGQAETSTPAAAPSTSPAAATTAPAVNKKPVMRPATEEEAGLDAILGNGAAAPQATPAPAPVAAPIAAAPAPRARRKPAAAPVAPVAAAVVEEEEPAPPATGAAVNTPANFDALLDQILNG